MDRILDNTAVSAYMRCPRLYYNSMVLHRRREFGKTALSYGKAIHTGLEILYKTHDFDLAMAVVEQKYADALPVDGTDYRTVNRATLVLEKWLDFWGHPATTSDRTVGWPDSPSVELSTNVLLPIAELPYAVRIDRIFELDGAYYIEDHKTTSQFGVSFYDEFELSGQMKGYARAAELLIGKPIRGVRINTIVTRKNNEEFDRRILYFPPGVLDHWERTHRMWAERIKQSHESGVWPQAWSSCSHKYGMCTYAEVCSLDPKYETQALATDFDVIPWDPNAQHDD